MARQPFTNTIGKKLDADLLGRGAGTLDEYYLTEDERGESADLLQVYAEIDTAKGMATTAQNTADSAQDAADDALELATAADGKASAALTNANTALSTANTAASTASSASASATNAQNTADSANTTATSASSTATSAYNLATSAQNTANTANASAATAQTIANNAATTATNAQNTADAASTSATNAQNTADTAQTTANNAVSGLSGKQDTLISGTNIKTINNNNILGSGNIIISSLPLATSNQIPVYDGSNWTSQTQWVKSNNNISYTLGNVGVGTSNSLAKLHVQANQGEQVAGFFSTGDFSIGVVGSAFTYQFGAVSGNTYSEIGAFSYGGNAWSNLVFQRGGGYVGFGTDSPTDKVDINGSMRLRGAFKDSTNDGGADGEIIANINGLPVWKNNTGNSIGELTSSNTAYNFNNNPEYSYAYTRYIHNTNNPTNAPVTHTANTGYKLEWCPTDGSNYGTMLLTVTNEVESKLYKRTRYNGSWVTSWVLYDYDLLNGGTNWQVLEKNTSADKDVQWSGGRATYLTITMPERTSGNTVVEYDMVLGSVNTLNASVTSGNFVVPVTGLYDIQFNGRPDFTNTGGVYGVVTYLLKDGTTEISRAEGNLYQDMYIGVNVNKSDMGIMLTAGQSLRFSCFYYNGTLAAHTATVRFILRR